MAGAEQIEEHVEDNVEERSNNERTDLEFFEDQYAGEDAVKSLQGLRCTVCYTFLGDAEEERQPKKPCDTLQNTSFLATSVLFQSLRAPALPRSRKLEETNLPLCLVCDEHLVEIKRVIEQITELENVLQSLEDEVKAKLLNSFDESSTDEWNSACDLMCNVEKARTELAHQFQKKRPVRGRKRSVIDKSSVDAQEVFGNMAPETTQLCSMKQEMHSESSECRKTSSGRIVKRPRTYSDMMDDFIQEAPESEDNLYPGLGDAAQEDVHYEESATQIDNPILDPEWSPAAATGLGDLPNEISDVEDEAPELNATLNRPVKKTTKSSLRRSKRAKVKSHSSLEQPNSAEVIRIPVKVKLKSGEMLNGVYFEYEEMKESSDEVREGHVFGIEDMKVTQGLRLACYEAHCRRTFTTLDKLKIHCKKVHPNSVTSLWHSCKFCGKKFISLMQLRSHEKELHCETSMDPELSKKQHHPCNFEGCNRTYRNTKELKIHIRSVHTGETPFSCDFCEERFVSLVKKEIHVESLHPEAAPLKCEFCSKAFFRNHRLRDHMKSHTGEKRYLCDLCGQAFSQPAYLRYHQTKHTELKLEPYKCPECDKTFATPVNLRIHRKTQHLKDYRFRCEVCNHGATHKSHLKLHMRTHSGERPYSCSQCEKTFTRGSQLTIHLRSHTGERPYKCKSCDKCFTNSSKLRRHEHVHSSEKPFKCSICDKAFSQTTNLNSHIRSCHTHKKESKKKQPEPQPQFVTEIGSEVLQFPTMFRMVDQNIQFQVLSSSEGLDGSEAFTEYIILNP